MSQIVKRTGRAPSKAALKKAITDKSINDFMWALLKYGVDVFDKAGSPMTIKEILELVKELNKNVPSSNALPTADDEDLEAWVSGEE